jgi:hypothetical protein
MPPNGFERSEVETDESREAVRQQLLDMQAAVGETNFTWDTEDATQYGFLLVPGRILVDEQDLDDFHRVIAERGESLPGGIPLEVDRTDGNVLRGTVTFEISDRENKPPRTIVETVREINETDLAGRRPDRARIPMASYEHWAHVTPNGDGRACPATEPEVTDLTKPFPDAVTDLSVGAGVEVVVIDTGYVDAPGVPADPNRVLLEYDGHGPFIEGVIESRAPGVHIRHLEFPVHEASQRHGGVVSEVELVRLLGEALAMDPAPDIVNISAGCHRVTGQPFEEFRRKWEEFPPALRNSVAVIAAAGNDRSPDDFFPAADIFATGVGSLDKNGLVSWFSNFEDSSDVFVLGRKHVNRFPIGQYTTRWKAPPEVRSFTSGWAEWSGTSFAAPLFAGLVAARMRQENTSARQAAEDLVNLMAQPGVPDPNYGDYKVIALEGIPDLY